MMGYADYMCNEGLEMDVIEIEVLTQFVNDLWFIYG